MHRHVLISASDGLLKYSYNEDHMKTRRGSQESIARAILSIKIAAERIDSQKDKSANVSPGFYRYRH